MSKLIHLLMLIAFCALSGKILYWARDGFCTNRVGSFPPCYTSIECAPLEEEILHLLRQPFTYLGRGRQCYVFSSQDGKYVLKLPRIDIYKKRKERRGQSFRNSIQVALNDLKDLTAIVAVHLDPTLHEEELLLKDRMGLKHRLPLGKTSFILQKKFPCWSRMLLAAEEKTALLDAFADFIIERLSRGIINKDESFLENYGYDGQKIIQLDIGSFLLYPKPLQACFLQNSAKNTGLKIAQWLEKHDPKAAHYFQQTLEEKIRKASESNWKHLYQ